MLVSPGPSASVSDIPDDQGSQRGAPQVAAQQVLVDPLAWATSADDRARRLGSQTRVENYPVIADAASRRATRRAAQLRTQQATPAAQPTKKVQQAPKSPQSAHAIDSLSWATSPDDRDRRLRSETRLETGGLVSSTTVRRPGHAAPQPNPDGQEATLDSNASNSNATESKAGVANDADGNELVDEQHPPAVLQSASAAFAVNSLSWATSPDDRSRRFGSQTNAGAYADVSTTRVRRHRQIQAQQANHSNAVAVNSLSWATSPDDRERRFGSGTTWS